MIGFRADNKTLFLNVANNEFTKNIIDEISSTYKIEQIGGLGSRIIPSNWFENYKTIKEYVEHRIELVNSDDHNNTDGILGCGCNKYTTQCSCSGSSSSCEVSCTSNAYACCIRLLGVPDCKCKPLKVH